MALERGDLTPFAGCYILKNVSFLVTFNSINKLEMVWWLILSPLFLLFLQISVSSCDLLVVSVGQMSMGRAINIVQKLWTAGIPAEIMYDWSQVEFLSTRINYVAVL